MQMPAGKKHDDMMFDVDSLQLGLSRPMVSVSCLDEAAGSVLMVEPEKTMRHSGALQGEVVGRTSSLGNGYDPAL